MTRLRWRLQHEAGKRNLRGSDGNVFRAQRLFHGGFLRSGGSLLCRRSGDRNAVYLQRMGACAELSANGDRTVSGSARRAARSEAEKRRQSHRLDPLFAARCARAGDCRSCRNGLHNAGACPLCNGFGSGDSGWLAFLRCAGGCGGSRRRRQRCLRNDHGDAAAANRRQRVRQSAALYGRLRGGER